MLSELRTVTLSLLLASAAGLQLGSAKPSLMRSQQPAQQKPSAVGAALATSLALAMATANPALTHAVEPPAVVQQYGSSMVADASEAELREAQAKFLEERARIKQTYDTDVQPTYINADEVADKKSIYVTLVGGLIVIAFVAPMLQFFYYTGGD